MALKLHTTVGNTRGFKAVIAGKYNGIELETSPVEFGVTNKTKEYLKINPNGKVPTLETPEGAIWESNAIARYVARLNDTGKLFGKNNYEASLVDQWIEWTRFDLELPAMAWLYPIFGITKYDAEATANAKNDLKKALAILNEHLRLRTYLVGERITLADIVVGLTLQTLFVKVLDATFRKPYNNVVRWFLTLVNQPNFKSVVGEIVLCEKAAEAPVAPVAAPVAAAPAAAAPAAAEAAEEDAPAPKKAPHPLLSLPPSKLDLDEWKRTYSNEKDTRKACQWFWENYDPEGYSIFHAEYKYPEDNQKHFMTCNLLGGFVQYADPVRKFAFASMLLFGAEPAIQVAGVWVFRGNEIPADMKDVTGFESYEFTRLDTNDPAKRQLIDDYFCWEGSFGGRAVNNVLEGKVFK